MVQQGQSDRLQDNRLHSNKYGLFKYRYLYLISVVIAMCFLLQACVVQENPVSGSQRAFGYSWQQEIALGQQADQEISAHFGLYENDELAEYVERVGREVLEHSHMRREDTDEMFRETEFYFRVLNSPVVNAFALPGGYIYVTRGLLSHLDNEAQLAVVLGHEIGHVAARHASQRAFNQQVGQIALIGGAILGQELLGLPGQDIIGLGGVAAQLLFLRYSRDHERESDRLGVEYSALAGYRAHEGSEFFRTLQRITERAGGSLPTHLSTHPDPGDRERSIIRMSDEWEEEGERLERTERDQYLDIVDGIIFGVNPREGYVENGTFYHPESRFQFSVPEGWQDHYEGNQMVVVEPQEQAIIIFQQVETAPGAREAVDEFGAQEGVEVTHRESISLNGLPGWLMHANAQTDQGELEFLVFGIEFSDEVYRFINYSAAANFPSFESSFNSTISSFRELNDPERLDVEPVRLQVITTGEDGTIDAFLPDPLPMDISLEEVAIINQVEIGETIESGRRIKIPQQ